MTKINLRDYYPDYQEDTFIEVSDEIAAILAEDKRLQINYPQYKCDNRAFYSLDCGDGIEAKAVCKPEQPDEAMERREREHLLEMAFESLPEIQRKRLYAHVVLQKASVRLQKARKSAALLLVKALGEELRTSKNF